MSPAQPQPSKPSRSSPKKTPPPIGQTILSQTNKVGQIVSKTETKVDEMLGLLTAEVPEGREDPIEALQQTLDFILARVGTIETQLDTLLVSLAKTGKLSR